MSLGTPERDQIGRYADSAEVVSQRFQRRLVPGQGQGHLGAAVGQGDDVEVALKGIAGGGADADIGCESGHDDRASALRAQDRRQRGVEKAL